MLARLAWWSVGRLVGCSRVPSRRAAQLWRRRQGALGLVRRSRNAVCRHGFDLVLARFEHDPLASQAGVLGAAGIALIGSLG